MADSAVVLHLVDDIPIAFADKLGLCGDENCPRCAPVQEVVQQACADMADQVHDLADQSVCISGS